MRESCNTGTGTLMARCGVVVVVVVAVGGSKEGLGYYGGHCEGKIELAASSYIRTYVLTYVRMYVRTYRYPF
jgi:hypothetical protein